ncbi:MAG TPA: alpha-L-fucosidase [Bryobacteraceae bacterium]|nr:alpha-L-fucosidase [Bryobacteraceae bacterium]
MKIVLILLFGATALSLPAAELAAPPERVQQWRDYKFGMFIHWEAYSLSSEVNAREILPLY